MFQNVIPLRGQPEIILVRGAFGERISLTKTYFIGTNMTLFVQRSESQQSIGFITLLVKLCKNL